MCIQIYMYIYTYLHVHTYSIHISIYNIYIYICVHTYIHVITFCGGGRKRFTTGKLSHIAYYTPIYNYIHDVAEITYTTDIYEIALEMHTYIHTYKYTTAHEFTRT